jgi:hypothetical protein
MALLNYTTTVAAARTVGEMSTMLVKAGARQVTGLYDVNGTAIGLVFLIETTVGPHQFALPVDVAAVRKVLERQKVATRYRTDEHAARVAWRILKDWLEAQLAIVATEMVTLDQVMLPYMTADNGQTIYEIFLDRQLALPAG